jgi:two-component system, NtrC family, response regulator AtoC
MGHPPESVIALLAPPERERFAALLEGTGLSIRYLDPGADVLGEIDARPCEIVVVDVDVTHQDLLRKLGRYASDVPTLALGSGGAAQIVEALHSGASDFIEKPIDEQGFVEVIRKTLAQRARLDEPPPPSAIEGFVGMSQPMLRLHDKMRQAAPAVATVLIRGESGTGKDLVARAIHAGSPRRAGPFVKIHCGALPDALLESELFGHEKGAFTGATHRKPGRVEVAEGGTLFLDEIGDITPAMQLKLLRLLQDREYERLGATQTLRADVRFVAATHQELEEMVKRGNFREDLFFRLNVVPLWLPPLRARRDDIELLARHFWQVFAAANGKAGSTLGDDAVAALRSERWPGNVRQLQNFVERLVVFCESRTVTAEDVRRELSEEARFTTQSTGPRPHPGHEGSATGATVNQANMESLSEAVRETERRALTRAMKHAKGNRTVAARILQVSRTTLYKKLAEHGLE